MKKRILSAILLAAITTTGALANTETLKPQKTEVKINVNDNMKLSINCTYDKHYKFSKYFRNQDDVNDLMELICENRPQGTFIEISHDDFKMKVKEFRKNDRWKEYTNSSTIQNKNNDDISYQQLSNIKNEKLNYHFAMYISTAFGQDIELEMNLPIVSFTNTPIDIRHHFSISDLKSFDSIEQYMIKEYKYDIVKDKIVSFEMDRPIKELTTRTYTNTYNIDEVSECINGSVWIKKYGAKSNDSCKWIEVEGTKSFK